MIQSPAVRIYRAFTFAITAFYFCFLFTTANLDTFGWQFRFLTVWGLTASMISAWFMLRLSMGWSMARHEIWASVTVVLNATVVLMYWKIYFTDPALFYGDAGGPDVLHQEYFLHALGPALQMFDAFFLLGAFRRVKATALCVLALPVIYILWAEMIVQPLNDVPVGSVTTGLPYLFLNNMAPDARMGFYATTVGTMLVLFAVGVGLAWVLRWLTSRSAAPRSL